MERHRQQQSRTFLLCLSYAFNLVGRSNAISHSWLMQQGCVLRQPRYSCQALEPSSTRSKQPQANFVSNTPQASASPKLLIHAVAFNPGSLRNFISKRACLLQLRSATHNPKTPEVFSAAALQTGKVCLHQQAMCSSDTTLRE